MYSIPNKKKDGDRARGERERERDEQSEELIGRGGREGSDGGQGEDIRACTESDRSTFSSQDPAEKTDRREGGPVVSLRHQEGRPPRHGQTRARVCNYPLIHLFY